MTASPPPPADLDLRLVRYFTVVAEHRHFGRAAVALRITQPSLSRQVRRLEHDLRARLFDRTPQGARLTEAGEVFLPRARSLLRSAAQAAAETHAAATPGHIVIGYTNGIDITPAMRELRRRHPDADVRTLRIPWNEPRSALLRNQADVVVCRLPLEPSGLQTTPLYDEPRVLLVPLDHRLVGKESVTLDDVADEPMPKLTDERWNTYWRIDPRPDGSRAPDGPLISTFEDKLEVVAAGQAVAILSAALHSDSTHPGITSILLEGVDPSQVVLATRDGEDGRLVASFAECARDSLAWRDPELGDQD